MARHSIWIPAVAVLLAGSLLAGAAGGLAATAPREADHIDDLMPQPRERPAAPAAAAAPKLDSALVPKPQPSGNPLWAIPLRVLSAVAARPLFSPTRRPAAPAVANVKPIAVAAPVVVLTSEKPQLTLLGTAAAEAGAGIAVFLEPTTKNVLRLKAGEQNKGWVLREVQPHGVVFERGRERAALSLPPPEMKASATPPPAVAPTAAPQGAAPQVTPAPGTVAQGVAPTAAAAPAAPTAAGAPRGGGVRPPPAGSPAGDHPVAQLWHNKQDGPDRSPIETGLTR